MNWIIWCFDWKIRGDEGCDDNGIVLLDLSINGYLSDAIIIKLF